ncbi:hypothetical protein ACFFVJ_16585 [Roseibium salinum]|uniref:hypothetical protein n=1 Tax=Roseibium salinum TaxID=1604349 RepID=UPI0035E6A204
MRRQQIGDPAPVFGHGGRQEVSRQLQKNLSFFSIMPGALDKEFRRCEQNAAI